MPGPAATGWAFAGCGAARLPEANPVGTDCDRGAGSRIWRVRALNFFVIDLFCDALGSYGNCETVHTLSRFKLILTIRGHLDWPAGVSGVLLTHLERLRTGHNLPCSQDGVPLRQLR